jgi:hypothetical protein
MSQYTIRQEIESKLKSWADSQYPKLPIAFENVSFEKPTSDWLELVFMPSVTINPTVAASRATLYGMFQINIYTKQDTGTKRSEQLAESIIKLFPVVPKTGTVSIEQTGSVMNPLYDSQWRILPLRFRYRQEQNI